MVGKELAALGLGVHRVALGEADVAAPDGAALAWANIRACLRDLLEDLRDQLLHRIKTLLVAPYHREIDYPQSN